MNTFYTFCAIIVVVAIIGTMTKYDKVKNNPVKLKEFKQVVVFGIIIIVILFGVLVACNSCLKRQERGGRGYYHNKDTEKEQIQYQNSREQQKDLNDIDNYSRENPDF